MIKIDGKEIRTESEQVWKNMEDIDKLQEAIKPEYTTDAVLTDTSVSVALTDTNAPAETTKGWLLTHDGLKFKITGGDDTNLLLEFYADLKGPQGESGAALNIDDTTTSATKVWSSQKTNNEIGNKIQNDTTGSPSTSKTYSQKVISDLESSGIAWTATDIDGDSKVLLSLIYLGNQTALTNLTLGGKPKLKVDDLVVYVDGDLKAKTLYRVSNIDTITAKATLVKVCDFSQGKQLYQHNISYNRSAGGATLRYDIVEINDDPTEINTIALFKQWLTDRSYTGLHPRNVNGGFYYNGSSWYAPVNIYLNSSNYIEYYYFTGTTNQYGTDVSNNGTVTDQVSPA